MQMARRGIVALSPGPMLAWASEFPEVAKALTSEAPRPPPRTPPHEGEGKRLAFREIIQVVGAPSLLWGGSAALADGVGVCACWS